MPRDGRTDWYQVGPVVGTALVSFLLGAAATLWLAPAAAPRGAATQVAAAPAAGSSGREAAASVPNEPVPGRQPSTRQPSTLGAPGAHAAPAAIPAPADAAGPPATAAPGGSAAAAAATDDGTTAPAGDFGLQFGAFLDPANAKSLLNQLAARSYRAASVEVPDGDGHVWHYIRSGAFAEERAAAAAALEMLDKTGIGAAVIRLSAANAGG